MRFVNVGKWFFNLNLITRVERYEGSGGFEVHFSGGDHLTLELKDGEILIGHLDLAHGSPRQQH